MTDEPYRQTILIHARQETLFRYFTEPEAIVAWMGDEAEVDPHHSLPAVRSAPE